MPAAVPNRCSRLTLLPPGRDPALVGFLPPRSGGLAAPTVWLSPVGVPWRSRVNLPMTR
jgi:hypothetical protein